MITPDFSAYAAKIDVHFHKPVAPSDIQARVEELMTRITLSCLEAGADLIGHIKCIVETDGKGFLIVSVTTHDGKPMSKGHLEQGIERMDIIINVLLYGLSRKKIQDIVDPLALKGLKFPGAHLTVEDLEKPHQPGMIHIHDHDGEHDHNHG
jgi:hypothetical protein